MSSARTVRWQIGRRTRSRRCKGKLGPALQRLLNESLECTKPRSNEEKRTVTLGPSNTSDETVGTSRRTGRSEGPCQGVGGVCCDSDVPPVAPGQEPDVSRKTGLSGQQWASVSIAFDGPHFDGSRGAHMAGASFGERVSACHGLPGIGGRIHVGMDKTNGYDFFYRQNVIKPALVGLAGPWISGGGVRGRFSSEQRP